MQAPVHGTHWRSLNVPVRLPERTAAPVLGLELAPDAVATPRKTANLECSSSGRKTPRANRPEPIKPIPILPGAGTAAEAGLRRTTVLAAAAASSGYSKRIPIGACPVLTSPFSTL